VGQAAHRRHGRRVVDCLKFDKKRRLRQSFSGPFRGMTFVTGPAMVRAAAVIASLLCALVIVASVRTHRSTGHATHALVGTLSVVDAQGERITLSTATGIARVALDRTTHIYQGARPISAHDLASHATERVKVWYRTDGDRMMAQEVRLPALTR
jgi:hypothetical protein